MLEEERHLVAIPIVVTIHCDRRDALVREAARRHQTLSDLASHVMNEQGAIVQFIESVSDAPLLNEIEAGA